MSFLLTNLDQFMRICNHGKKWHTFLFHKFNTQWQNE